MTNLHASSRKQLLLQLLNKRTRLQSATSKGFTLIELLVVIVILGVLGAVGYGAYINQIQTANDNTAVTTATALAKNCAALLVTGDEGDFVTGVDPEQISVTPTDCALGNDYSVTVDDGGNFEATATAQVTDNGAVIPGGLVE